MATLMPWTTVELGDFEIFIPTIPCLVVNTWYSDGEPASTVTHFWEDEDTGLVNHEVVFAEPVGFDAALKWAQDHAPTRGVERIHIKHGPAEKKRRAAAKPVRRKSKKKAATGAKMGARAKAARERKRGRKRQGG